jgi:hypothetical protein
MKFTSRERPEALLQCVKEYCRLAADSAAMQWVFSLDKDDPKINGYDAVRQFAHENKLSCEFYYGVSQNKIDAINRDVRSIVQPWDILLNISDDQLPVMEGYDNIIRGFMPNSLDMSLWFNDGHQDRINTQEIVGRAYYESFGYIYHPSYKSFFCDNEQTEIAVRTKRCVFRPELTIVKHFHPSWMQAGGLPNDALYKRNEKFWAEDEANYNARKAEGYGRLS